MRASKPGVVAAVAVAAMALLAACSGGGGGDGKAKATSGPPKAATASSAPTSLRAKWSPKLEAVAQDTDAGICVDSNTDACADAVNAVTSVVYDLEDAIRGAGRADDYPETLKHIDAMANASDAYIDDGCRDAVSVSDGCGMNALLILRTPTQLKVKLFQDEEGE